MSEKHTCGECARFKVPDSGCTYAKDIREGIVLSTDAPCPDFYHARTKKEKAKKKQLKDSGFTVGGCFEAIYHNGKPCFLVKNNESFSIVESLEFDDGLLHPKEAKNCPYEPYGYFEGPVSPREDMFWKINREFQIFVDVEPVYREVLSACVLLSYQQEKLQTVPYLLPYGDNESGKTTVLNVLNELCYRPLFGVTVPSADIYGYLEDSDAIGCVLEDEIQGIHRDLDKVKIYKSGYKAGATVPRTIITNFDRSIKYYRTFCFKTCASEQLPTVKGFRERFIEIAMVEGSPEKEWTDLSKEDWKRLHDLRNMLLKWRMLSREWELPDVELPSMKGRLKELWKPILQITSGLTVYDSLFKFVENQRKERLSVKQDTLEGKIVKVVTEMFNENKDGSPTIPFQTIWCRLREELDGKIDDKKPNVMDTSDFFLVTKNKVGYRLREVLSGKSKPVRQKSSEGNDVVVKAYEFDSDKLRRIAKKYGFEFVTKLPSLLSSEGVKAPEGMEKTTPDNVEIEPRTPQQLGKLGYSVTAELPTSNTSKNPKEENTEGQKNSNLVANAPSSIEALEHVRRVLANQGFTEYTFESAVEECGLKHEDAERLFWNQVDAGQIAMDPEGLWKWAN